MHRRRRCGADCQGARRYRARQGMTQVARDTGLSRESLYKASGERAPDFSTILKVLRALGLRLHATPCLSAAWQPSYDAVPEPGAPFPVAPFRLSMTASRLLSVALLLAAFQLGCRRRLRRGLRFRAVGLPGAQSAQDALEGARRQARRHAVPGAAGPAGPALRAGRPLRGLRARWRHLSGLHGRRDDREAGMLASQKSDWIKVCGPLMK